MCFVGRTFRFAAPRAQSSPRRSPALLIACAFAAASVALGAQTVPRFRAEVTTVTVAVTVADANGRLITGLTKDDFEVYEEGAAQRITQFSDVRGPVSLGVLLDASDSMRGEAIVDARSAFDRFVGTLLDPGDEAFAATFSHRPTSLTAWKRPPALLAHALDTVQPTGGTAIYDALVAMAPMFDRRMHTRAALVVISDGADTASDRTLQQAREILRRSDAFVYAVAIDAPGRRESTRVNPAALREITGPTGGYTEVVRGASDLVPATERIADELNKQYTIGYTPSRPPDGQWRSIRVRMTNPAHFARARRGYYASVPKP